MPITIFTVQYSSEEYVLQLKVFNGEFKGNTLGNDMLYHKMKIMVMLEIGCMQDYLRILFIVSNVRISGKKRHV